MFRIKNKLLVPIFLTVAVDVLGYTIVLPLLPFYAEKYGAPPTVVGLLVTIYAASQFLSSPLLGRLSDRWGRKPLLLVSQTGTLIGFVVLARADALWLIFLSRLIDGLTAGNLSLAQAYISDVTEPKDRTKAFGIIGIAFGMGFLVGPGITAYLSQFGYQYPVWVAAALSATSILTTYLFVPGSLPPVHVPSVPRNVPRNATSSTSVPTAATSVPGGRTVGARLKLINLGAFRRYFSDREIAGSLLEYFLFAISFSLYVSGFALFAERRYFNHGHPFGVKEVGYIFAYSGVIGVIVQGLLLGRLVSRFGEARLSLFAFGFASVGYAVQALTNSVPAVILANTIYSLGNVVLRPALTSQISQKAPHGEQGAVLGVTQSLNSLAQVLAPILSGVLIQMGWLTHWSLLASVMTLLGLTLVRRNCRHSKPPFISNDSSPPFDDVGTSRPAISVSVGDRHRELQ